MSPFECVLLLLLLLLFYKQHELKLSRFLLTIVLSAVGIKILKRKGRTSSATKKMDVIFFTGE